MRVKLDENLGRSVFQVFRQEGHDTSTVFEQELSGEADSKIFAACLDEERVLITLDHDFGNLLRFPPSKSGGTVILEAPPSVSYSFLADLARMAARELKSRPVQGQLWIVQPGRIRVRLGLEE